MAELGVSGKQTPRARQALQRSAEQAGFFRHGRDRLVHPPTNVANSADLDPATASSQVPQMSPSQSDMINALPAPLPDLWLTLLREGRSWSAEDTYEFVEAARKLHDLMADRSL
jgi:hypothetical protein